MRWSPLAGLLLITLLDAALAAAQLTPLIPLTGEPAVGRHLEGDVAFDDKHDVYLMVYGYGAVSGIFIGTDGTPRGEAFPISRSGLAQYPRVAYSTGGPDDVFLVVFETYLSSGCFSGCGNLMGQLVRYTGGGPTGGELVPARVGAPSGNFTLDDSGITTMSLFRYVGEAPDVAYNPNRREFLTTWGRHEAVAEGTVNTLIGRRFHPAGIPLTANMVLAGDASAGSIAYDWVHRRYLVAYAWNGVNAAILNDSGRTLASGIRVAAEDRRTHVSSLFLPEAGFLVLWNTLGADGTSDVRARRVMWDWPSTGTFPTDIYPVMTTRTDAHSGYTQTAHAAYNPITRRVLVAASQDPGQVLGRELDAAGEPIGASFELSSAPHAPDMPAERALAPRIAAGPGGQFALHYVWLGLYPGGTFYLERFTGAVAQEPAPRFAYVPTTSGDFDGDAHPDLLFQHTTSKQLSAWSLVQTSVYQTLTLSPEYPDTGDWRLAATPDLNADGYADILWQNTTDGRLRIWYMNRLTRTDVRDIGVVGNLDWWVVGASDMNGDGRVDLVWQHQAGGWLAIWLMYGEIVLDTSFLSIPQVTDSNWKIVGVGDLNGDHRGDLVWQHATGGWTAAWFMDRHRVLDTRFFTLAYDPTRPIVVTDPNWRISAVGLFDDDEFADVIWQHAVHGTVAVWTMDSALVTDTRLLRLRNRVDDTNTRVVAPK